MNNAFMFFMMLMLNMLSVISNEEAETKVLSFDFSSLDFETGCRREHDEKMRQRIEELNPEKVVINSLQERYYFNKITAIFRQLGFQGSFQDLRRGRGVGIFYRKHLHKNKKRSVFHSKRPDPL